MEEDHAQLNLEFGTDITLEPITLLGVGKLFLARDITNRSPLNLVVFSPGVLKSPDKPSQFVQRLVRVSQQNQPNIAPRYVFNIKSVGQRQVVTEFFQGVFLNDKLTELAEKNQHPPTSDVLSLIRELANTLAAAYGEGLLHQNLTPENIFIKDGNEIALIILGIPWVISPTHQKGNGRSTNLLSYASPEQILGKEISVQSNIYTLGIILYELLAGHRPEIVDSPWDIFDQDQREVTRGVPLEKAREGLRPETYHLVQECLWQEEWNRFESYDEMIAAIDQAIAAEQAPNDDGVVLPRSRRPQTQYLVIPLILLFILIGFVIFRNNSRRFSSQSTIAPQPTRVLNLSTTTEVVEISQSESTFTPQPTRLLVQITPALTNTAQVNTMDKFKLVAPLPDSEFALDENISFDWSWPDPLESNQQFSVYLHSGDESIFIGTVNKPIEGNSYHLLYDREKPIAPGSFFWQVVLEEKPTGEVVAESDWSLITLTPGDRLSLSVSTRTTGVIADEVEATPTTECRPLQPDGWVGYIVKQGDALSALAVRSNITVEQVQQVNCLDGIVLSIGHTLWLPPVSVRSTSAFTPTPVPSTIESTSEPPSSSDSGSDSGSDSKPTSEPPPEQSTPTPPLPPTSEPPTDEPPTPEPPSKPTPTPP